ncbi:hypothetical protein ACFQ3Z_02870 [Streptomyces nogalater]
MIGPGASIAVIAGPLLMTGLGAGVSFGVGDGAAMSLVEPERAGMATGFLNTMRIGSEAIVIAVYGAVLVSLIDARVGSRELAAKAAAGDLSGSGSAALADGFTHALHLALYGTAAVCAVGAVAIFAALAPPRRNTTATPLAAEPARQPTKAA